MQTFGGGYSVQADGVLSIAAPGGLALHGAVAPAGHFAALGGSTNLPGPQVLWLLLRK